MATLLILGAGYTASRLAAALRARGWQVTGTSRDGRDGTLRWGSPAIIPAARAATHILSSIPPGADGSDPALDFLEPLLPSLARPWLGYLSSTGVYPDTRGGWVDEAASIAGGHRSSRVIAEARWQALGSSAHIFRLPGIYGPGGRSTLDRVRDGRAHRIDLEAEAIPDHVFCRIHVDDIVAAISLALDRPPRGADIWNISDDEPASGNAVIEHACDLLGLPWPPRIRLDDPALSPMARSFYRGWRRVKNDKMKRDLGLVLRYPDYRDGLAACLKDDMQ
jgi:nucleoside-diphosphate-sugar epimerase